MKSYQNIITAIDIGTSKIVTIAGKMDDKGFPEILGLSRTDQKGFEKGIVLDKEDLVNAIRYTVDEVQKQAGFVISEAYVGIAGLNINSSHRIASAIRNPNDAEISKRDTERILENVYKSSILKGEEIISIIPQSFIIDGEKGIKSPYGCNGKRFEIVYLIVTDQLSSVSQIKQCVNLSGINVKGIFLASVASSASVLTIDEIEAGALLVDIGANSADMAVFYDGQIKHLAVIHILIAQTNVTGIVDAIVSQLDISEYRDKLAAGIVITGGGAQLKDLKELIESSTGLEVRIGLPKVHISPNHPENVNSPIYSSSAGLLNLGFEKVRSEIET
jgi:cell division protein FtsA